MIVTYQPLAKSLLLLLFLVPAACTKNGMAAADSLPDGDRELIDVVSFETGCPAGHIEIVERPAAGRDSFEVAACGRDYHYKRTDSVFHSANMDL